jgi:anti-sigma B factor antagonist
MIALIKNIDFESRSLTLEVTAYSAEHDARLRDYISHCDDVGYRTFHIVRPDHLPKAEVSRLDRLKQDWQVSLWARGKGDTAHGVGGGFKLSAASSQPTSSGQRAWVDYTLRCLKLDGLLNNIRDFVLLVGSSLPLDTRLTSRLRLGVYELAVNSIEHATFVDTPPQVEINIRIEQDNIRVVYKDNAAVFETTNHDDVSIDNQIKTRSTRGLGLSMISKISNDLNFERTGKWNCTTFTLDRNNLGSRPTKGERTMEDFSVELIPFKAKDTVVLRPKGSIDSTSVPALENQLKEAIKNEQFRIVIDLSKTDFISSAGLGLILGTVAMLRENGGDMILMKIPQDLSDIFELMSVDDYFQTIDSVDELSVPKP